MHYRHRITGEVMGYIALQRLWFQVNRGPRFPALPTTEALDILQGDPVYPIASDRTGYIPGIHRFDPLSPEREADGRWYQRWTMVDARDAANEADLIQAVEQTHTAKKAAIAEARWRMEVAGLGTADGIIATDDRSKLLLQGKYTAAERDPERLHRWKGEGGEIGLTSDQIIRMGGSVESHVQRCFDWELDHQAALKAIIAENAPGDAILLIREYDHDTPLRPLVT